MIYIVQTMDKGFFVSPRKWNFIQEQLGKEVCLLNVFTENDAVLNLIKPEDTVIVQTRKEKIIQRIIATGAAHTGESQQTIFMTEDKDNVKQLLSECGIQFPKTVALDNVEDGHVYFVKPVKGYDSEGVDECSVCRSRTEVIAKYRQLQAFAEEKNDEAFLPLIEEFIEGNECTVAIFKKGDKTEAHGITIHLGNEFGIQTYKDKMSWSEWCEPNRNPLLLNAAINAFDAVGCQHFMRIDFREAADGTPYLIDFNLYPGLGPIDHLAKCLAINNRMGYYDILMTIAATAKR